MSQAIIITFFVSLFSFYIFILTYIRKEIKELYNEIANKITISKEKYENYKDIENYNLEFENLRKRDDELFKLHDQLSKKCKFASEIQLSLNLCKQRGELHAIDKKNLNNYLLSFNEKYRKEIFEILQIKL